MHTNSNTYELCNSAQEGAAYNRTNVTIRYYIPVFLPLNIHSYNFYEQIYMKHKQLQRKSLSDLSFQKKRITNRGKCLIFFFSLRFFLIAQCLQTQPYYLHAVPSNLGFLVIHTHYLPEKH
jgi:hypothetical protein